MVGHFCLDTYLTRYFSLKIADMLLWQSSVLKYLDTSFTQIHYMCPAPGSGKKNKKKTMMQKIKQRRATTSSLCVCESLCTQPLICECSAGALLECCQRLLAVICVWLRVSRVCMCGLSVFLSAAAAGTHASPPHHDTHQTLFSCSPDLLLTFPPYSPPPTLTHTHNTLLNPCFSLLAGQLSVPVLSLSAILHCPVFLSLSLSLPLSLSGSDPEAAC